MALNTYATVEELKAVAASPPPQTDAVLLDWLEDLSRAADTLCDREFFVSIATKHFDPARKGKVAVNDLLSVFELKIDTDADQVPDEVIPSTNYLLIEYNDFPKRAIQIGTVDPVIFVHSPRAVQLDAVWGFGDGESDTPWLQITGETVTVADATTTTIDVLNSALYGVGGTYRVAGIAPNRDEYFFVKSKTDATHIVVRRGVNGSTAADHSGVAVFKILVHPTVKATVIKAAVRKTEQEGSSTQESERIGGYSYTTGGSDPGGDFIESFNAEEAARLSGLVRMRGPGI